MLSLVHLSCGHTNTTSSPRVASLTEESLSIGGFKLLAPLKERRVSRVERRSEATLKPVDRELVLEECQVEERVFFESEVSVDEPAAVVTLPPVVEKAAKVVVAASSEPVSQITTPPTEKAVPRTRAEKKRDVLARAGLLGLVGSEPGEDGLAEIVAAADANLASIASIQAPSVVETGTEAGREHGLRGHSDAAMATDSNIADLTTILRTNKKGQKRVAGLITEPVVVSFVGSEEVIRERLAHYGTQVRTCYERRLKSNESLSGRLVVEIDVDSGVVFSSQMVEDTVGDRMLSRCVQRSIKNWSLPSAVTGQIVIPYTLTSR